MFRCLIFLALFITRWINGMADQDFGCREVKLMFVDFDKTITRQDTTSLFYKAAFQYKNGNVSTRMLLDQQWTKLGQAYMKGYYQVINAALTEKTMSGFDPLGLERFLRNLSKYDRKMVKATEFSAILKGIDKSGLNKMGEKVQTYEGSRELLKVLGSKVRIVSLNWSKNLIAACLHGFVSPNQIFSNQLMRKNVSEGNIIWKVRDSFAKRKIVNKELRRSDRKGVSVFIGDSPSDMLGMLSSDVGIIIGNSRTTHKIARKYGITLVPLRYYAEIEESKTTKGQQRKAVLYKVASWGEIEDFLTCKFN